MKLDRNGSLPTSKGPTVYFSGNVYVSQSLQREDPSRLTGATVTFMPGARSAWHTHPLG